MSKKETETKIEDKKEEIITDDNLTSPLIDKKTLNKYRIHWYQKIPYPIRALLIKYWFFGLVYFLFEMGIGAIPYFRNDSNATILAINSLILILITGLGLGVFNDFLVYNILDVIEDEPGERRPYIFFKNKKFYSMLINIVYGEVVCFISLYLCGLISMAISKDDSMFYFREPLTCGLMMFIIDYIFVSIKNLVVYIYKKYVKKISNYSYWRQNEI